MDEQIVKVRLLLVDDEEDFLAATSKVLMRRNMEVATAPGGKEALEMLRRQEVDVVVLDMKMPGMDGEEVFEELNFIWPHLPVIVLTGHDSLSKACMMTRKGVFDYVLKPCDIDVLAGKIHEAAALNHGRKNAAGGEGENDSNDLETVRVLLVDDERPLLDTLKKVLTRRAMVVITAENGEEALSILKDTFIDVVVLDIKMPGMDGLEVLKHIKAGPVNREVILLTGHPTVDNAMTGMKQGAFEYLMKPPDVAQLTESIRKAHQLRKEKRAKAQEKAIEDILRRYPD